MAGLAPATRVSCLEEEEEDAGTRPDQSRRFDSRARRANMRRRQLGGIECGGAIC
jgi:hypothetical protein